MRLNAPVNQDVAFVLHGMNFWSQTEYFQQSEASKRSGLRASEMLAVVLKAAAGPARSRIYVHFIISNSAWTSISACHGEYSPNIGVNTVKRDQLWSLLYIL